MTADMWSHNWALCISPAELSHCIRLTARKGVCSKTLSHHRALHALNSKIVEAIPEGESELEAACRTPSVRSIGHTWS